MIGPTELIVCVFIALLLFGNRVPNMVRVLGQSVKAFKEGIK